MKSVLFFFLLSVGFQSFADEVWHHQTLRSKEGIDINIDFQFRCQNFTRYGHLIEQRLADPVWINVHGIEGNHIVTAEIEFYTKTYTTHGGPAPELVRSYNYYDRKVIFDSTNENRFTKSVNSMVTREDDSAANYGLDVIQKIKFQIDEKENSIIDPISGSEWFQVQLDDHKACL